MQKKDADLKIIEGLHSNDLDQEVHNINISQTDKPINHGPATHVMVLTLLKIVMIKFLLNVNLTLIIIPHLNALGDAPTTNPLTATHIKTIQLEIHRKLVATLSLTYNFQFPPTSWTRWLNCWKPLNK